MARINIEEDLFRDSRFIELVIELGDQDKALGALVRAWIVAQQYWKKDKSLIPSEVFAKQRLSTALIKVGLATQNEDGLIYIAGSEEQFAWLVQKQTAGRAGGLKSLGKKVSGDQAVLKRRLSVAKRGQAALSGSGAKEFITHYCEAFKVRYQTNPVINGKAAGIASRLIKDLGLEKAKALVGVYLSMNDQYYITRRHDLVTLEANLNAVQVKHDTGTTITRAQSISAERDENNALALKKALERLNESSEEIGI